MKNFLAPLLVAISFLNIAQNTSQSYKPYVFDDTLYYKRLNPSDEFISESNLTSNIRTVIVDSSKNVNDTLFLFTPEELFAYSRCNENLANANVSNSIILGESSFETDDTFYAVNGYGQELKFKWKEPVGNSWTVYESGDTIVIGQILSIEETNTFGNLDSVKSISLDLTYNHQTLRSDTILLSRNQGLMQTMAWNAYPVHFIEFQLVGTESSSASISSDSFLELAVGDEYHYTIERNSFPFEPEKFINRIIAKEIRNDSMFLDVSLQISRVNVNSETVLTYDTISKYVPLNRTYSHPNRGDTSDNQFFLEKAYHYHNSPSLFGSYHYESYSDWFFYLNSTSINGCTALDGETITRLEYFGIPEVFELRSEENGGPPRTSNKTLKYLNSNSITWGTPLNIVTSANEPQFSKNSLELYPNPISQDQYLYFNQRLNHVMIRSNDGRLLRSVSKAEKIEIDLDPGLYILNSDEGTQTFVVE